MLMWITTWLLPLVVKGCPMDKSLSCHGTCLQDSNLSSGQYFPAFEHSCCLDATFSLILIRTVSGFKSYFNITWICIWWSQIRLWWIISVTSKVVTSGWFECWCVQEECSSLFLYKHAICKFIVWQSALVHLCSLSLLFCYAMIFLQCENIISSHVQCPNIKCPGQLNMVNK